MDTKGRESGIQWGLLANSLFWNFDGLYDASVIAGEVQNPATTYPRVLLINIGITIAIYVVPLVSAVTATSTSMPWIEFDEYSFPNIAKNIGGSVLQNIILVSSILSLVGLFTTSIMFQSFQVLGMAHLRLLPAAFRTRHKTHQTPQYAVYLSMLTTMLLLTFDYESILSMTNAFSAAIQVKIVLAMLQLRRKLPHITRPTKVPGPLPVISAILVPTSGVFLYILFTTLFEPKSALAVMALVLPGAVYGLYRQEQVREELEQRARQQQQIMLSRILHPDSQA